MAFRGFPDQHLFLITGFMVHIPPELKVHDALQVELFLSSHLASIRPKRATKLTL